MDNKLNTLAEIQGTWILGDIYYKFEDGSKVDMYGPNPVGILMYDAHGKMNAQLGKKDRQIQVSKDSGTASSGLDESYIAYYGDYYEDSFGKIIHEVIGCTNPSWIAEKEIRFYEIDKNILKIWTPPSDVNGKNAIVEVIWHRCTD